MEGIYVFGFDSAKGQQLYIDAVKNYTSTGVVDGFFGDKWSKEASAGGGCPVSRLPLCLCLGCVSSCTVACTGRGLRLQPRVRLDVDRTSGGLERRQGQGS